MTAVLQALRSSVAVLQSANQDTLPPASSCQSFSRAEGTCNKQSRPRPLAGPHRGPGLSEARRGLARYYVMLGGLTDY